MGTGPGIKRQNKRQIKYWMDPKLFEQRLRELGHVEQVKPKLIQGVKQTYDEVSEVRFRDEFIQIGRHQNPSLGLELKEIRLPARPCEFSNMGCDRRVEDQEIEHRFYPQPLPHWRQRCVTCGAYPNPQGEALIRGSIQANNAWNSWCRSQRLHQERTINQKD